MHDLIIVGAGPCGIATTKALSKVCPKLNVKVIETRPKTQGGAGAQVGVNPNGLKALEAIDENLFKNVINYESRKVAKSIVFDENDKEIPDSPLANLFAFDKKGQKMGNFDRALDEEKYATKLIGWSELTQAIKDSIEPQFEHSMLYSTKCRKVELLHQDGDQIVQVTLDNGQKLQSKYLIGCDGYFSTARTALYGTDKDPVFGDTVYWRGRLETKDLVKMQKEWDLDIDIDFTQNSTLHVGFNNQTLTVPVNETQSIFVQNGRMPFFDKIGLDISNTRALQRLKEAKKNPDSRSEGVQIHIQDSNQQEIYERLQYCLKHTSKVVQHIAKLLKPDRLTEHGIYITEFENFDESNWGKDNVLLIGDACHATRPTGQGLSMSFEDAATIGYLIKDNGLNNETFKKLASERTKRVKTHLEIGSKTGAASFDKNKVQGREYQIKSDDKLNQMKKVDRFYTEVSFQKL